MVESIIIIIIILLNKLTFFYYSSNSNLIVEFCFDCQKIVLSSEWVTQAHLLSLQVLFAFIFAEFYGDAVLQGSDRPFKACD